MVSQILASPPQLRQVAVTAVRQRYKVVFQIGSTFFGIWNLDFFCDNSYYASFCVDPKMSTMQVIALDYLIGIYPIILILLTYSFVLLHDRFSLVVKIWSPFQWCLSKFHRNWEIRNSIVGYFATFILLSYIKILNVSFDLPHSTT